MNNQIPANKLISGSFFTSGLLALVTGQLILSTALFGTACLATNLYAVKAKPARV